MAWRLEDITPDPVITHPYGPATIPAIGGAVAQTAGGLVQQAAAGGAAQQTRKIALAAKRARITPSNVSRRLRFD